MNIKITVLSIAALLTLFVVSCKKSNDPEPNLPPAAFTVTPKLAASGTDVVLTWTKAKDPNGDPVTYAVVYKDTLAKNLTDTTYTIKNVGYGATVVGSVVASDNQKASTVSSFSITTGANPYVAIPDVNFEKALIDLKIDDIQDGKLLIASAQKVTSLDLSAKGISSLKGIEAFIKLQVLNCSLNSLTNLDISKNVNLIVLDCYSNQIPSLDVSKNINLTELHCDANKLSSLDVSTNISLARLYCALNKLSSLDLSKNINLGTLACDYNQLQSLDVSKNIYIISLGCTSNQLSSLDVSKNTNLTTLTCYSNQIQTICVAKLSQVNTSWKKDATAVYKVCQ